MRRRRLTLSSTSGQIRRTAAASSCPTGVCTRSGAGAGAASSAGSAAIVGRRAGGAGRGRAGLRLAAGPRLAAGGGLGRVGGLPAGSGRIAGRSATPAASATRPAALAGPSRPPGRRRPASRRLRAGCSGPAAGSRRLRPAGRAGRPGRPPAPPDRRRRPRRAGAPSAPAAAAARPRPAVADGSSIRADTSSSSNRGDVVPRISISPVCTMSAIRDSVAVPEPGGLVGHPLDLVGRAVEQALGVRVRHRVEHDQVAQPLQQVGGEPARVVPGLDHPVDRLVHRRRVAGRQRVDHLVQQRAVGDAEQPDRTRVRHALRPGPGDELVEHGQRVPGRPAAGPDHERQHGRLDRDPLGRADRGQQPAHHARRDQPERVVVRPRPDRGQHLVRLGRREHEDEELRRLLDELEQGVEALRAHHVRLVDDVDLVARAHRREEGPLAQVAGVVDAAVRGRVDLDHVEAAGTVRGERDARVALAARVGRRAAGLAVERAGQDPGAGGLAAATRAGEQVRMVDPAAGQRLHQRLGHVLLTDHLGEGGRTVLPVERESHAATLVLRYDRGRTPVLAVGIMVCHAGAVVVSALVGMGALLLAAAVLSAGSARGCTRAYREALRELRDGDRRLEPGAGPGRRLEDELRWYADVTAAGRDSGWRYAAAVVVGALRGRRSCWPSGRSRCGRRRCRWRPRWSCWS